MRAGKKKNKSSSASKKRSSSTTPTSTRSFDPLPIKRPASSAQRRQEEEEEHDEWKNEDGIVVSEEEEQQQQQQQVDMLAVALENDLRYAAASSQKLEMIVRKRMFLPPEMSGRSVPVVVSRTLEGSPRRKEVGGPFLNSQNSLGGGGGGGGGSSLNFRGGVGNNGAASKIINNNNNNNNREPMYSIIPPNGINDNNNTNVRNSSSPSSSTIFSPTFLLRSRSHQDLPSSSPRFLSPLQSPKSSSGNVSSNSNSTSNGSFRDGRGAAAAELSYLDWRLPGEKSSSNIMSSNSVPPPLSSSSPTPSFFSRSFSLSSAIATATTATAKSEQDGRRNSASGNRGVNVSEVGGIMKTAATTTTATSGRISPYNANYTILTREDEIEEKVDNNSRGKTSRESATRSAAAFVWNLQQQQQPVGWIGGGGGGGGANSNSDPTFPPPPTASSSLFNDGDDLDGDESIEYVRGRVDSAFAKPPIGRTSTSSSSSTANAKRKTFSLGSTLNPSNGPSNLFTSILSSAVNNPNSTWYGGGGGGGIGSTRLHQENDDQVESVHLKSSSHTSSSSIYYFGASTPARFSSSEGVPPAAAAAAATSLQSSISTTTSSRLNMDSSLPPKRGLNNSNNIHPLPNSDIPSSSSGNDLFSSSSTTFSSSSRPSSAATATTRRRGSDIAAYGFEDGKGSIMMTTPSIFGSRNSNVGGNSNSGLNPPFSIPVERSSSAATSSRSTVKSGGSEDGLSASRSTSSEREEDEEEEEEDDDGEEEEEIQLQAAPQRRRRNRPRENDEDDDNTVFSRGGGGGAGMHDTNNSMEISRRCDDDESGGAGAPSLRGLPLSSLLRKGGKIPLKLSDLPEPLPLYRERVQGEEATYGIRTGTQGELLPLPAFLPPSSKIIEPLNVYNNDIEKQRIREALEKKEIKEEDPNIVFNADATTTTGDNNESESVETESSSLFPQDSPITPSSPSQLSLQPKVSEWSSPPLVFESRFESGNLLLATRCGENAYNLMLRPDRNTYSHMQWFFFRCALPSLSSSLGPYTFTIMNLRKKKSLYTEGLRPLGYSEKMAKEEGRGWFRIGHDICYFPNSLKSEPSGKPLFSLQFSFSFCASEDTMFFAHCFPYTYSDLCHDLGQLEASATRSPFIRRRTLCHTLAGNSCDVLTITARSNDLDAIKRRKGIAISARVHPGETNSSYICRGVINFLTGTSEAANYLRELFVFRIVPMLNPDGVINGNSRCSLSGHDLNRKWHNPSPKLHPTIYHTKNLLQSLTQQREVVLFCDLHGHSAKRGVFIYGCDVSYWNKRDGKGPSGKDLEKIFPFVYSERCSHFSFPYSQFHVRKSKETTGRVVCWRFLRLINSFTLECSFLGPEDVSFGHFSTEDLEGVGEQFCLSLCDLAKTMKAKEWMDAVIVETFLLRQTSTLNAIAQAGIKGGPLGAAAKEAGSASESEESSSSDDEIPPPPKQRAKARRKGKKNDKRNGGGSNAATPKPKRDKPPNPAPKKKKDESGKSASLRRKSTTGQLARVASSSSQHHQHHPPQHKESKHLRMPSVLQLSMNLDSVTNFTNGSLRPLSAVRNGTPSPSLALSPSSSVILQQQQQQQNNSNNKPRLRVGLVNWTPRFSKDEPPSSSSGGGGGMGGGIANNNNNTFNSTAAPPPSINLTPYEDFTPPLAFRGCATLQISKTVETNNNNNTTTPTSPAISPQRQPTGNNNNNSFFTPYSDVAAVAANGGSISRALTPMKNFEPIRNPAALIQLREQAQLMRNNAATAPRQSWGEIARK